MIDVEDLSVTVAAFNPNLTMLASARLVPVIVTVVPPATEPLLGLTALTVGGAM